MQIAILGGGAVGQAQTRGWSAAGHHVKLAVRDPQHADRWREFSSLNNVTVTDDRRAVLDADVVSLCVEWPAVEKTLRACRDLTGKILIEVANPLNKDHTALAVGHTTSGAELVAQWAPGARVVKALNHVGAEVQNGDRFEQGTPVVFLAGDDVGAKQTVAHLVTDLGFDPLDAGDLTQSRLLEPLAMLWVQLAIHQGLGRHIAWTLLRD